jgi:hypothetical protein
MNSSFDILPFTNILVAWPDPVPSLNVYSLYNGLLVEWTKSHRYMQLLYSLRCEQLPLAYNKLKVMSTSIKAEEYIWLIHKCKYVFVS